MQEKIEKEALHDIYECPSCGANLKYSPDEEALLCEYCKKVISLKGESSEEELDFLSNAEKDTNDWAEETVIVGCDNCGARNVVSKKDITSHCPFCGSAAVIKVDELVGEKPNRVIPFKIGKEGVIKAYKYWIKKKLFAPSKVKKEIPNPILNGVYIPTWTYDTDTISAYNGRLGDRYTVTVGTGKNRHTETRIRYFYIKGVHSTSLDDILVCSGKKLEQSVLDKLSPYDTNASYVYDERYLAGFAAEHYDLSLKNGWEVAKKKAKKVIEREILSKYSYDLVDYLNVNTTFDEITYKYVILPVWICNYSYNNKKYQFIVNGETGKIIGKAPVSPIKVSILVLVIILVIIGILLFFGGFGI